MPRSRTLRHRAARMKWRDYCLTRGDDAFTELWRDRGRTRTLVVIGGDFDPRAVRALSAIAEGRPADLDIVYLELDSDAADGRAVQIAADNLAEMQQAMRSTATLTNHPYPAAANRRSAGILLSRTFHEAGYLDSHDEAVIDISGLPRSVYFPLVEGVLQLADRGEWQGDLHVVVCDNPQADASIVTEGAETTASLGGFPGTPRRIDSTDQTPALTVWVPILGEGRIEQLEAVWSAISPDEVMPVLPFPSADPRRADNLLLEYREFLFDAVNVEPRNFMHADESNPFDLYRSLVLLHDHYQEALQELAGARFVLSTHSSKLLSVGALLAGHELRMEIQHASPTRSGLSADADIHEMRTGGALYDIWLTGEPYR